MLEDADRVYLVDAIEAPGAPGDVCRYEKDDFMLNRLPVKLSPHQIGIQEVLALSEIRGCCPGQVTLFGVIPESHEAGVELSPTLAKELPGPAGLLVEELTVAGHAVSGSVAEEAGGAA